MSTSIKTTPETPWDILQTYITFDILDPMAHTASWFLYRHDERTGRTWVADVSWRELLGSENRDTRQLPSSFTTTLLSLQYLTDRAWMAGVKPSDGTGSAGSLRATEEHVETLKRELKLAHETIGELTKIIHERILSYQGQKPKIRIRALDEAASTPDEEKGGSQAWQVPEFDTIPV